MTNRGKTALTQGEFMTLLVNAVLAKDNLLHFWIDGTVISRTEDQWSENDKEESELYKNVWCVDARFTGSLTACFGKYLKAANGKLNHWVTYKKGDLPPEFLLQLLLLGVSL